MISYLDRLKAKIQETSLGDELSKPSKPPSHLETYLPPQPSKPSKPLRHPTDNPQNSRNRAETEAAERATSIPLGYTRAEIEAARRDAERLGYGINRKLH